MIEIDGVPTQRHQFDGAQPMPIGDQHHGRVAMTVAIIAGGLDQSLDLGLGEVLTRPDLGIGPAPGRTLRRLNCPINSAWGDQGQMPFFH